MVLKTDEIRRHGVPFSIAWDAFATPPLREEFDAPPPAMDFDFDPGRGLLSGIAGVITHVSNEEQKRKVRELRRAEIIKQMKIDLYDWLMEDDLVAYGFQLKPNLVRTYRKIPALFWDNAIPNWEDNAAYDLERHYHKILIIEPDDFPEIDFSPKIGRKSEKSKILRAIRVLDELNPNFRNNMVHKERLRLIRNLIIKEYPQLDVYGNNFGDDTIRKIITNYLNKRKRPQSQDY